MDTVEITLQVPDAAQEYLIAELADLDFEGFQQEDDVLKAYIPASRWDDVRRQFVAQWLITNGLPSVFDEQVLAKQNWNRTWEESMQPIAVGPFLIKPTWAETPPEYRDLVLLEIDPKMSFGTGFHESTRLALQHLARHARKDDLVLDAGTGTGVLAIAALRMGARRAVAFDIDEWAQQNAVENFLLNGVHHLAELRRGSIRTVPETDFDLILANINRNVLLDLMPALGHRLNAGGRLIVAGLLLADREAIEASAATVSLKLIDEATEGNWWSAVYTPL